MGAQKLVAQDFRKLYKGDPTATEMVKDFTRTSKTLAVDLPSRMLPNLEKSVVVATEDWSGRLDNSLREAHSEEVVEAFKKFNHYTEKLGSMTDDKKAGKLTSSAQKEAYQRNQEKLISAK